MNAPGLFPVSRVSSPFTNKLRIEMHESGLCNVLNEVAYFVNAYAEEIKGDAIDNGLSITEVDYLADYQTELFRYDLLATLAEAVNKKTITETMHYLDQSLEKYRG